MNYIHILHIRITISFINSLQGKNALTTKLLLTLLLQVNDIDFFGIG